MATQIGTVKNLVGTVKAISTDGTERLLQIGDIVYQNERIITGEFGAVEIEFPDGSFSDLGRNSEFLLDPTILLLDDIEQAEEVQQAQDAILEGQDLTLTEDPTAAGPTENEGNEGTSIIRVDHIAPETIPVSGFDTTGIAFSAASDNEELNDRFQNDELPVDINGLPSTTSNLISALDDDTLGGNAGGISDNNPDNENLTGTLNHDYGSDGPGSLLLTAAGAPAGFVYTITNGGTTLTISQNGQDILQVELNNTVSGEYTITQLGPLSHEAGNDENDQILNINYQVTDGNGDTAQGLLQINIDDDTPVVMADTGAVTEGALLNVDAASGVLANDSFGADLPGTPTVSGVAAGNNTATAITTGVGTAIAGSFGTLTLAADGSYTYQATANAITADMQDTFVYTITDSDGDTSTTTLTIDVANVTLAPDNVTETVDEAALPDGSNAASNDETVTGQLNVAGTGITYNLDSNANGNNGKLTLNNDGSFSYTLSSAVNSGATQGTNTVNGVEVFNYTATDTNGNTTQGTITINVVDDVPSVANNATILLDDDALANGNAGGVGDDLDSQNATGTLAHSYGADGEGSTLLLANGAPRGFSYDLNADGTVLTISQNGTDVIRVTLADTTSGNYTVEQLATIDHRAGGNENNQNFNITYRTTDGDGDFRNGRLQINVDDDTPVVMADTDNVTEGGTVIGNVITNDGIGADGPSASGSIVGVIAGSTTNNVSGNVGTTIIGNFGTLTLAADGSYTYQATANNITANSQDTFTYTVQDSDGDTSTTTLTIDVANVTLAPDNVTETVDEAALPDGSNTASNDETVTGQLNVAGTGVTYNLDSNANGNNGKLTLNNDGSFSYTLSSAVNSGATQGTNTVNGVEVFNYTATDTNGNTTQGTITINVVDDVPSVANNATILLDDDALANGNAGGVGDDLDSQNTTGTLAHDFGADGAGNISLLATGAPAGFSYAVSGNTLTISQGTTDVMSFEVNPTTGSYTVQQLAAIDHAEGNDENNQLFTVNYTVSDADGDTANGNVQINVDDDSPATVVDTPLTPLVTESFENLLTNVNRGWNVFFSGGGTYTGDQGTEWTIGSNGLEAQKLLSSTLSASDGDVHLELDVHRNSQLSTDVELSASNATLSFDYKPRTGGGDSNMKVTLGGVEVNIEAPNTSTANITAPNGVIVSQTLNASGWFSITLEFTDLTPGNTTLQLEGAGSSNGLGALLDNVSLVESALQVDETDLNVDASHDFSSHFTSDYGSDGFGDFVFNLNNTNTGLTDTATGESVILSLNATTGAIEGRTATSNEIVFTVTVDNAGVVTLDQQRAIEHPDNTQPNESVSLPAGLIGLTITDGDGDKASDELDISTAISFRDDAPVITTLAGSNDQDTFAVNGDERVTLVQSDPANRVVDHWQFRHDGGQLTIDLDSERYHGDLDNDGDRSVFDSYIYLFTTDGNGNIENFVARNDDVGGATRLDSGLTLNLPADDYDLAVGAWPFTEAEARGDTHDRNMGTYNITFGGDNDGVVLQSSPVTGSVLESSTTVETTTATLTVDNHVDIDVGADEAGSSIDFTLEEVTILGDLTSNGKAVTFEARDTDADGQNDQIVGSTEDGDVLSIEGILDSTSEVHLFAPVNSTNAGTDDVQITANLNVTDGDGDNAITTLNFNLDINQVIETPPSRSETT